ncbi:YraN family protein [Patescibacteria group bacterium]|nr:YraN family protein [Patescibacteria group bacterium]MBU0964305.1 YraN family protein [Patescibacteria group bacterium]
MKGYRKILGQWGEQQATNYLNSHGYSIVATHWQRREGEIDLIAFDKYEKTLVFIEVKTRTSDKFGQPGEVVSNDKISKIECVIDRYFSEKNVKVNYRLDIIAVVKNDHKIKFFHYKNICLD